MEANIITQIFLPLALFIIMLGMGLALQPGDFKRVFLFPKAVAIGIMLKVLLIPVIAFGLLKVITVSPELAVGVILLAACPGGATSNLIANLAKGDVALSITLTAIASVITVLTIPFFVQFGLEHYMEEGRQISLPFAKTVGQILAITVVPVVIGMVINAKAPQLSEKAEKPVKIVSALFLVLIIGAALGKEWENLPSLFAQAGPIALILNLIGMAVGYFSGRLLGLAKPQNLTLSVETGIVNGTLGIAIAAGILENSVMTIPSAIYSLIMFPMIGFVIYYGNRK